MRLREILRRIDAWGTGETYHAPVTEQERERAFNESVSMTGSAFSGSCICDTCIKGRWRAKWARS